jgi:hypothetical protein
VSPAHFFVLSTKVYFNHKDICSVQFRFPRSDILMLVLVSVHGVVPYVCRAKAEKNEERGTDN